MSISNTLQQLGWVSHSRQEWSYHTGMYDIPSEEEKNDVISRTSNALKEHQYTLSDNGELLYLFLRHYTVEDPNF